MKQKLLNSIRLRVCMLVAVMCAAFAGQAWGDTTYRLTKVTSVSAGNKYVFERNDYVLKNTVSSSALQTTGTYSKTGLAGNESYIWELETATGGFYLKNVSLNSNQYLNNTSSTSVSFGTKNSIWTIAFTDDVALISNKSNSDRFLGDTGGNSPKNTYKAYAASNLSSYPHDFTVYLVEVEPTPVTGVSLNKTATTLEVGDTETLTATVVPDGATNKNVSWSSDDEDVATVDSNGKITAVAEGSATITVTTEDGSHTATCNVTVNAASKIAVNMTGFSATSTTIVRDNTTGTSVTNDQSGWTAAYTYTSSDETVATVAADGTISAVAKGTATITASLNVSPSDATYKAGATSSMDVVITVQNPSHTVTFSNRGSNFITPVAVEEGESITFPGSNPEDYNGYTFVGWARETITGTTEEEPTLVTSATMSTSDVIYYAVYAEADVTYDEYQTEKTQTHQYDTWTYSGTTTDKSKDNYRLFGQDSYIQSASFDLSLLKEVYVYAGTFGTLETGTKKFTIKAGETTWATSNDLTTNNASTSNRITSEVSLSGTGPIRIISTVGDGSSTGLRISKVEIYTKKRIVTYSHYCTTVTDLPKPVITMDDVEMTWGDNDKYVAPIATINEEAYEGSFTYTVNKVGLTVAADGKLTSSTPGTYVVTASIAATAEHQDASTTCTVTVGKQDVTLSFANETVRKKISDETYTQAATPTPAAYDGTIAYSKENTSTSADATVNSSTGAVAFSAIGSVIVKATAPATVLYNSAEATYTILVQTDPEIDVENQTIAYGSTFTVDNSAITGGDITVTSSNPAIATVEGLVITPVAVGTTTITVATAESDTYVAGEEMFTLTVTAPAGASEKPILDPISVFYESFEDCNSSGGNDSNFATAGSTKITSPNDYTDNDGWTLTNGYPAKECLKFGGSSNKGSATSPSITVENGQTYTLSFKAAPWNTEASKTMTINVTGGTINDKSSATTSSMTAGKWNDFEFDIVTNTTTLSLTIECSANRFFLDEVRITKPATPITSTTVTTNGGYATYCYQYPLNLDGISGAKAYKVSSLDKSNEKVMLTKITGTIKGGVPFILKSDADTDDIEIPLADESDNVPEGNLLIGTLAPTFVEQVVDGNTNFAYSKSKGYFVKLGDDGNTVPANRAYLPINLDGSSVKAFSLSFDTETGINEIGSESGNTIFNLAGQRVNKAQKGLYIMNGKKVLVK